MTYANDDRRACLNGIAAVAGAAAIAGCATGDFGGDVSFEYSYGPGWGRPWPGYDPFWDGPIYVGPPVIVPPIIGRPGGATTLPSFPARPVPPDNRPGPPPRPQPRPPMRPMPPPRPRPRPRPMPRRGG